MADYFIAIGGTGARVTESLMHLCDCGYFRSNALRVLIIDADEKNGNKTTSEDLIKSYRTCRANYHQSDSDLFKTDIESVFSKGGVNRETFTVSPVSVDTNNFTILNDLVKQGAESRDAINVMKALYSEDDYKRNIKGGFYAHPSVGALMFERWLDSEDSLIDEMIQEIRSDSKDDVNIFIVASSFGGTGASGFPSIAKKIRESYVLKDSQSKIHIAGCFMLPYFDILNAASDKTIDFAVFNESAKNALQFYTEHKYANFFDKIYLLGNPDAIIRGIYADVGEDQKNWPHVTELLAAIAADDFYQDKKDTYDSSKEPSWVGMKSDCENTSGMQWTGFPRGDVLRKCLSKFLLFNLLYVNCVCKRVLVVKSADSERVTFDHLPASEIKWRAIKSEQFGKFSLLKKSNKWSVDASNKISLFSDLYHYHNMHIEWLYRLITEHEGLNKGSERVLRGIFGDNSEGRTALEKRYKLSQQKDTASAREEYKNYCDEDYEKSCIGFSKAFTDNGIAGIEILDSNIEQIEKPGISSIDETIKSIIQKVYNFSSDIFVEGRKN